MASVEIRALAKRFGAVPAVAGIDFAVDSGQFLSLLGPSGCGKTTTLRMIAGLEEPDAGAILIDRRDVSRIPAHARNMGLVFQSYALFPHMTVRENVGFGLLMRGRTGAEAAVRVNEALTLTRLDGLADRYPRELSGGQQQRVALSRALAFDPAVLLLDEPLSNLDLQLRNEMRAELRRLQRRLGITTILVTHDQEEALTVSDRVIVMAEGAILQDGAPEEVYRSPAHRFVAGFIGESALVDATVASAADGVASVETDLGRFAARCDRDRPPAAGTRGCLCLRPESLILDGPQADPRFNAVLGRLEEIVFSGSATRHVVGLGAGRQVAIDRKGAFGAVGDAVRVSWLPEDGPFVPDAPASRGAPT